MSPPQKNINRNLGEQPFAAVMASHGLRAQDLVNAFPDSMTHKMVKRGCKGRWCTIRTRTKLRDALNQAAGESYSLDQLFTY